MYEESQKDKRRLINSSSFMLLGTTHQTQIEKENTPVIQFLTHRSFCPGISQAEKRLDSFLDSSKTLEPDISAHALTRALLFSIATKTSQVNLQNKGNFPHGTPRVVILSDKSTCLDSVETILQLDACNAHTEGSHRNVI